MNVHEKIRLIRELKHLSQEDVAEQLNISTSGYAKIERGESQLNLMRLEQIAAVLNINVWELLKNDSGINFQINTENTNSDISFYTSNADLTPEIKNLKMQLQHKEELLEQKDREIRLLTDLVASLKAQLSK